MALAVMMLLSLTACGGCSHEWAEATCTAPSTCTKCGEVQGEALGHYWQEASCAAPETCYHCGETQGEALPHSYGAWDIGESDMSHSCTVCGEAETLPLDYQVAVEAILEGNWDFYLLTDGTEYIDVYSVYPGSYMRFDADGSGIIYTPEVSAIAEYTVDANCYSYQDGVFLLNLVFDDSSMALAEISTDERGNYVLASADFGLAVVKNEREAAALAGIWTATANGQINTLELKADRELSGSLNGEDVHGVWTPMPVILSQGTWYTGFNILYTSGGDYSCTGDIMWLCYEGNDPYESLQWSASNIGLYIGGEYYSFDKVSDEEYEALKTAHEEGADKVVGSWDTDSVEVYNTNSGETVNEPGSYSITFNADGSYTAILKDGESSGQWSYRGARYNGNDINYDYNVDLGPYEGNYITIYGDGTIRAAYQNGSDYYTYNFSTAELRAAQAEAEAAAAEASAAATAAVIGSWTSTNVSSGYTDNSGEVTDTVTSDYSITVNEDGSFTAVLMEGEFSGTWEQWELSDGEVYFNLTPEGSDLGMSINFFDDILCLNTYDEITWNAYMMTK